MEGVRVGRRASACQARGLLATLAAVALLVTACGDGGGGSGPGRSSSASATTTNVYFQQRTQGVTRLLDALASALHSGSSADLAALLDPSVTPALRDRLQTAQDNLSPAVRRAGPSGSSTPNRLRLKELRYQLAPTEEAETLIPAGLQARLNQQGSSDTWVAPVEMHVALGGASTPGIGEDDVVINTQLVAARYDDTWKLVGDATLVGEPAPPTQMWDLPGLTATDVATVGGTSVIASYPGTSATVDRIRKLLPGAVAAVSGFWGSDWAQRAAILATDTDDQFHAVAGSATDTAAAATIYARLDLSARTATGQRVILTPAARDLPDPVLGVVLRHELTHVATRAQTATAAPMWLTEGVAEYVGRKGTYTRPADAAPDLAAAVQSGQVPTDLPSDAQFSLGGDSPQMAYQSAWSVAAFVAGTYGENKLKTLYTAVGAAGDGGRQDAALAATLGLSRAQFVQRWQAWLTRELR
ncbi:peptidase MA family metallohydrolase [Gordonia sp. DT30]|uniref:peptidase MA family metallohydrolase n=1 Tax=unclassified Gordonia (in: high G+C Gram-positive bacteria) TaxID=2657482 RepID=UPI003CF9F256